MREGRGGMELRRDAQHMGYEEPPGRRLRAVSPPHIVDRNAETALICYVDQDSLALRRSHLHADEG